MAGMKIKAGMQNGKESADYTHYEQESPKIQKDVAALRKTSRELLDMERDMEYGPGAMKKKMK